MRDRIFAMDELKLEIWEKVRIEVCKTGQFTLNNENVSRENVSRIQVTSDDLEIDGSLNIKFNGSCEVMQGGNHNFCKQSPAYFSGEAKYDGENIILSDSIEIKLR